MTDSLETQSQDNLETHLNQVQTLLAKMQLVESSCINKAGRVRR